jgi:hypothetical protein
VAVVETPSPSQLPDALDGVEFWAIGRKKVQGEASLVSFPPLSVETGMVIGGVVGDDDRPATGSPSSLTKLLQEGLARDGVKAALLAAVDEAPVAKPDGTEVLDALPGRLV